MPFTFSHPAAILPFCRYCPQWLNLPALVIGSIIPDLGYYLRRFDLAGYSHTALGSLVTDIPFGILALAFFYGMRRPFCFLLTARHRDLLLPLCVKPPALSISTSAGILASLFLGIWSHLIWDSFTHRTGWVVRQSEWLSNPVIHIAGQPFSGYYLLQQFSTVLGAVILLVAYLAWMRKQTSSCVSATAHDCTIALLWIAIAAISLAIAIPYGLKAAAPHHGYFAFRVFVFKTAVTMIACAAPQIILAAILSYSINKDPVRHECK